MPPFFLFIGGSHPRVPAWSHRAGALVLAVALLLAAVTTSHAAPGAAAPIESRFHVLSNGREILVERYAPADRPNAPRLVFLHGSGGLFIGAGQMHEGARELAQAGFDVCLPHYFERTGTIFVTSDEAIKPHFKEWLGTVNDVVNAVATRETPSPRRVGLFGYSLGAYLALETSALNRNVAAVVSWSGGMHDEPRRTARHFPPALLIHGANDQRVSPDRSREVAVRMERLGMAHELIIVPGQGHTFDRAAVPVVRQEAVKFFRQYLRK